MNGPVLCAGGVIIIHDEDAHDPHSLAPFDTEQANHCTSVVRGLRPHLWRCGNISFEHLEGQGGSKRSGSVCVQKES